MYLGNMDERIFIGVAWPYADGPLHLGHVAGAYLPADVFARYHRTKGNEVLMVSGSDQHGTPITLKAEQEGKTLTEQMISDQCVALVNICRKTNQTIIFVTNELGMGLVPIDPVSRRYRDCLGRCNQTIAMLADKAVFMVSGIPLTLK